MDPTFEAMEQQKAALKAWRIAIAVPAVTDWRREHPKGTKAQCARVYFNSGRLGLPANAPKAFLAAYRLDVKGMINEIWDQCDPFKDMESFAV